MKKPASRTTAKKPATILTRTDAAEPPADSEMFLGSDEEQDVLGGTDDQLPASGSILEESDIEPGPSAASAPLANRLKPVTHVGVDEWAHALVGTDVGKMVLQSVQDCGHDKLLVGSICSGWGVAEMCVQSLNKVLCEMQSQVEMEAAWMCEQTPWKLEMLKKAFPGVPIFENMLDLHRKLARNVVSGQYENVRSVQGAICGYPCKSVSAQNSDPKSIRDASSTSGAGFRSLMKFVDSQPDLQWVVFENVARFTHSRGQFDGEQPSQVQARELKKRGFFNFDFVLNASNFGLRQSRSRAWLLYVRSDALKVNFTMQDMTRLMGLWQQDLLPMKAFVHEGIRSAASRRKGGQQATALKWVGAFEEIKKQYGEDRVRGCQQKLTELGLPLILVEREVAVMVTAILQMEEAGRDVWTGENFFIQVDQNFQLNLWNRSNHSVCPCLIPRGKYVVCGPGAWRILTGQEKASLQGVSPSDLARYKMNELSDNQLSDLCGNSFTVPMCMASLASVLASWDPARSMSSTSMK